MAVARQFNRSHHVGNSNYSRMLQYPLITLQKKKINKSIVFCALAPSSGSSQPCIHLQTALLCIHEAVAQHVSPEEHKATRLANQYANLSLGELRNVATAVVLVWATNREKEDEMGEGRLTSSKGEGERKVEEVTGGKRKEFMYNCTNQCQKM